MTAKSNVVKSGIRPWLAAEVKILSKLSHPYLMTLVGVGKVTGSGHLFVASEMLSGGSLQKLVMDASVTPGRGCTS